jgi:hypothetical protein
LSARDPIGEPRQRRDLQRALDAGGVRHGVCSAPRRSTRDRRQLSPRLIHDLDRARIETQPAHAVARESGRGRLLEKVDQLQ